VINGQVYANLFVLIQSRSTNIYHKFKNCGSKFVTTRKNPEHEKLYCFNWETIWYSQYNRKCKHKHPLFDHLLMKVVRSTKLYSCL